LSALYVLTEKSEYRDAMKSKMKAYSDETEKQVMSDKQKKSFIDGNELKAMFDRMTPEVKVLMKTRQTNDANLNKIQNYIMLALYGGVFIPPRRSQDYTLFKISNVNKEEDNFFDQKANQLVFNRYKTAKHYGRQAVDIPKELTLLLKKWIAINPTEFLFFDKNKQPLNNVKMNQRLNRLVGKDGFGVNGFRHSYMTTKYAKSIDEDKEMKDDFEKMGSSINQEKVYVQKK
jgi:integrase